MRNLRPPGKNAPPTSPGYPGGLRPPVNNSLNAWSGPTWRNPGNPLQVKPPPTSPFSRLPPKLPPVPKGPGLGIFARLKPTIPGLLIFGGLLLLDWWLSQPPPPGPTLPPSPTFDGNIPTGFFYRVWFDAEKFEGGRTAEGVFGTSGPFSGFSERAISDQIWEYVVTTTIQVPNGYSSQEMTLAVGNSGLWGTNIALSRITNAAGVINIKRNSIRIIRIENVTTGNPVPPTFATPSPTPPYALAPTRPNNPPITSPVPQNPTPTNPAPLQNPPGTVPPFTPFPGPEKNKSDNKEKQPGPWFTPFPSPSSPFNQPFNLNPNPTSTRTGPFVVNDPAVNFNPEPSSPLRPPTPNPNPITTPTNPITSTPPNSKQPTTTEPPDPNKDKNPLPFFPPFPIANPQDPKIQNPENPPPPINQTPPGNNCCVPIPIDNKLDKVNNKLDLLTPSLQAADLLLLRVIDNKLGPQINGGLSGYLQDRFTKLWKSRVVDRALNLMATAASIHNAVMLSRNIGSTLVQTLGNALSIIGIKDGDEVAQNFSTVIGDQIENIVKGLVGAENYTQLTQTWAKANRIYQSAINIYQLMTDSLFGITEGLEQAAKYTGKIGNALRKSGVVLENSYNWMSETFNFSSGKNRKIDRVIEGLQQASEVASDLESITSEFRSVTENVAEINTQINTIKTEINGKEEDKKNNEDNSKNSSQSPQINKSDLIRPDN